MSAAVESGFVLLFAGLLAIGAVVFAFFPLLRHVWIYTVSRRLFAAVLVGVFGIAIAAAILVNVAVSTPSDFLPAILVTVVLRLASPSLLFGRIQDRFDASRWWRVLRVVVGVGFLSLAAVLVYDVVVRLGGNEPPGLAVVSEQFVMACGASVLIVRVAVRGRPRISTEWWPIWTAAVLFSLAFIVVLPYAVPAFGLAYGVSGAIGWFLAVARLVWDR